MSASSLNLLAQAASDAILAGDNRSALTHLQAMLALQTAQPDLTCSTGDGMRWDRQATIAAINNLSQSINAATGIQTSRMTPARTRGGVDPWA